MSSQAKADLEVAAKVMAAAAASAAAANTKSSRGSLKQNCQQKIVKSGIVGAADIATQDIKQPSCPVRLLEFKGIAKQKLNE